MNNATAPITTQKTYVHSVTALFSDIGNRTKPTGTEHDLVVVNEGVLVHAPEYVTSRYVVANLHYA